MLCDRVALSLDSLVSRQTVRKGPAAAGGGYGKVIGILLPTGIGDCVAPGSSHALYHIVATGGRG